MGRINSRKRHLREIARNREAEKRAKKEEAITDNHLTDIEIVVEDIEQFAQGSSLEEVSDIDILSSDESADDEPEFNQYELSPFIVY